jgi:acyl-CoA dehydrogenase
VFDDLNHFVDQRVRLAEIVFREQMKDAPEPFWRPPILQELKAEARVRGLWNLFLSERLGGAGLTNVEYAPMAERLGRLCWLLSPSDHILTGSSAQPRLFMSRLRK